MAPPVGLEPTVRLRSLPSLALAADNALCCRLYASRPLCGFALQNPAQARRFIGVNNKKRTSVRCPSFCVYVRQNLVFRAIFESVSNEKVTNDFSISVSFALF